MSKTLTGSVYIYMCAFICMYADIYHDIPCNTRNVILLLLFRVLYIIFIFLMFKFKAINI